MNTDRQPVTYKDDTASQENLKITWGRLIPCKQFLKHVDLVDCFTFGRSEECSLVINADVCPENIINEISKKHFRIEIGTDKLVYITDLSKNGTFVNSVKLGNGKRKILKHNDIISLANAAYSVYIYKSLNRIKDRDCNTLNEISDEDRLPDTLTPKEEELSPQENLPLVMPWGRLISCKQFLQNIDLVDRFTFGRSEDCSLVVTAKICPKNILFNISKMHFRIEKNAEDNLVYITDLSKNGTFVNRVKLGNGITRILQNDALIAIGSPANSIYIYREQGIVDEFLPSELMVNYANIRKLGHGACGEVRLVKDRNTFNQFAVKKVVLGENRTSQQYKINHPSKVTNEINILRSLSHPCIVGCEKIIQCDKEVYMVLEYMAGGELTKRVMESPVVEDCVKFYFLQMLHGVQYLHSRGIIHRDLKPDNILLLDNRQETVLKITDFGLSKVTLGSDMTTMCGTLRFVAPEVINRSYRDNGEYGRKVDIWSMGVILFFMLSKEYPFVEENNNLLAKKIMKCSFSMTSDAWSDISHQAKDLIKRILVVNPKKRLTIQEIFYHPWIKYDYAVQLRVEKLLIQEGLEDPMQDLALEPPEKKFKFDNSVSSSSSSGELDNTLVFNGENGTHSSGTLCY